MALGTVGRFYKKYGFSGDCAIYYFLGFILLNLLDVGDICSADLLLINGLCIIASDFYIISRVHTFVYAVIFIDRYSTGCRRYGQFGQFRTTLATELTVRFDTFYRSIAFSTNLFHYFLGRLLYYLN